MNTDIRKYIKVGLIHFMAYPATMKGEGPILETLKRIAKDDYFDAVEVTWIKDGDVRSEAKKIIETSDLEAYYGAQPRLLSTENNPNAIDEAERTDSGR